MSAGSVPGGAAGGTAGGGRGHESSDAGSSSDEELVAAFQSGERRVAVDELLARHRGLVWSVARRYFVPGGDDDDVRQQAMIGFWKAVRDFDVAGGASFTSFAHRCMQRQVLTAVKAANRRKHTPLTESERLGHAPDAGDGDGETDATASGRRLPSDSHEGSSVAHLDLAGAGGMPVGLDEIESLIERHGAAAVHELLRTHFAGVSGQREGGRLPDRLTENEAHVLVGLLSGYSYREIAEEMDRSTKFVDNTIQRLRTKLRHLLD